MRDFEEWAKSLLPKWSDKLVELGASWDSFRREPEDVIADLEKGGIPLLSARDIVDKARDVIQRSSAPLAIFWDLDTIPIPPSISARDAITKLKSNVASFGQITQLRGYTGSSSSGSISEQHRKDLTENGFVVVDSPQGGKEVATKRIIIDALKFESQHVGSTVSIAIVSADNDISYLVSSLQERSKLSTMLISTTTSLQRMSDVVCESRLSWESDILQQQPARKSNGDKSTTTTKKSSDGTKSSNTNGTAATTSYATAAAAKSAGDTKSSRSAVAESTTTSTTEGSGGGVKLTKTDIELLKEQISAAAIDLGDGKRHSALKSRVGSLLRIADPQRFPTRDDLTVFLVQAVDDGIVIETGYGEYKILTLTNIDDPDGEEIVPPLEIKKIAPHLSPDELPDEVVEICRSRPYVVFVPWSECINRETFPPKAYVHSSEKWAMLLFETLINAQQAAVEFPWLRTGDLIDWRRNGTSSSDQYNTNNTNTDTAAGGGTTGGGRHNDNYNQQQKYYKKPLYYSHRGHDEQPLDEEVRAVLSVMEMLLRSDELYVAEPVLRYQLAARRGGDVADRQYYAWIEKAVSAGIILLFKRPGVPKGRFYCLPNQLENSRQACSPFEIDTYEEEKHIINILVNSPVDRWVTRKSVIESLQASFPRMKSPSLRVRVFQNGAKKGLFFVAKDGSTQVVAQTKDEAHAYLKKAVAKRESYNSYHHNNTHHNNNNASYQPRKYPPKQPYQERRQRNHDGTAADANPDNQDEEIVFEHDQEAAATSQDEGGAL